MNGPKQLGSMLDTRQFIMVKLFLSVCCYSL